MLQLLSKIDEQSREIELLKSICQDQSQTINRLMEFCTTLKEQNENDKREILHDLGSRIDSVRNEVNSKFDRVVQLLNDNDTY